MTGNDGEWWVSQAQPTLQDLLIAGTALAHDRIIVTNNRKHFERIPGLIVEDWSV